MGLATAVIIHIEIVMPVMTPTVNGSYAKYRESKTTGKRIISIHNALLRFDEVISIDAYNPPSNETTVIADRESGALSKLLVGIAVKTNVELGFNSSAFICILSPHGVLVC